MGIDTEKIPSRNSLLLALKLLVKEHALSKEEVAQAIGILKEDVQPSEMSVPLPVFSVGLGPLEAIVRHLREHEDMPYKDISLLIGRNLKTLAAS